MGVFTFGGCQATQAIMHRTGTQSGPVDSPADSPQEKHSQKTLLLTRLAYRLHCPKSQDIPLAMRFMLTRHERNKGPSVSLANTEQTCCCTAWNQDATSNKS